MNVADHHVGQGRRDRVFDHPGDAVEDRALDHDLNVAVLIEVGERGHEAQADRRAEPQLGALAR